MSTIDAVGPKIVTRTYGRGSFLAFLSPLLAIFMAKRGLNGWEQTAAYHMQQDAMAMQAKGYRVTDATEYRLPFLGIAWFRVTYRLGDVAAST